MNFTTTHIRSEKVTIDTRIYTILNGRKKPGEVYLAAIAPDMELTIITLDEAPGILPCFEEDDACLNLPNTSLLLCYNPAQVLKMGGKHYLTGPVMISSSATQNVSTLRWWSVCMGRSSTSALLARSISTPWTSTAWESGGRRTARWTAHRSNQGLRFLSAFFRA